MGIVEGYADQLHDYWDDFDEVSRKNYLKAIRRNSNKIAAIVDELLSFSSLSQAEIDMQPLNMGNIVNQATNRVGPWIHGFDGQIQTPDEWPIALGHPSWVEEVWVNYISNAMKYGGSKTDINLGYTVLPNQSIQFWVQDFGEGLSNDEQEIVFNKHTRFRKKDQEGHGLGLSIVKRIIEKLQGEVGVSSKLGEGARFYFTLPTILPDST